MINLAKVPADLSGTSWMIARLSSESLAALYRGLQTHYLVLKGLSESGSVS
jgi:hypothetical protein